MKRVLIVSFLFPPLNNVGALRVGKFAKYLTNFGWEPVILTADRVWWGPQTLPLEIGEERVIRTGYGAIGRLIQRKLSSAGDTGTQSRGMLSSRLITLILRTARMMPLTQTLLSDHIGWYLPGLRKGLEVVKNSHVDAIFSSSPPTTAHLIASRLAKRTGIPWVADFRDAWSRNPYRYRIQPFQFLEEQLERKVTRGAKILTTVSEPLAENLRVFHSKEVVVVYNGFDAEDYRVSIPLTSKFTITHTGTIYWGKRDPLPLFMAMKELYGQGKISSDNFEIRFFGTTLGGDLLTLVRNYGLETLVKIGDFIPFRESVLRQKESTVLLCISWNDPRVRGVYTAKIFEYMAAGRPILALAPKGDVIDLLLRESVTGIVANEVEEVKNLLSQWLDEFQEHGSIHYGYNPNLAVIRRYTRCEQTRKLSEVLQSVLT